MAEIIFLHEEAKKQVLESSRDLRTGGTIYRILFCGQDRRGIEIASSSVARAFLRGGFYARFDEAMEEEPVSCSAVYLRLGREIITETGFDRVPGLIVTADGDGVDGRYLQGCDGGTILLVRSEEPPEQVKARTGFPGSVLPLPVSALTEPEPWYVGASCAGGAVRLLGNIPWTSLEEALREELTMFDPSVVHRNLARALESFDRLAPWAGLVQAVEEDIQEEGTEIH